MSSNPIDENLQTKIYNSLTPLVKILLKQDEHHIPPLITLSDAELIKEEQGFPTVSVSGSFVIGDWEKPHYLDDILKNWSEDIFLFKSYFPHWREIEEMRKLNPEKDLVVKTQSLDNTLHIRVDSLNYPEFWFQFTFDRNTNTCSDIAGRVGRKPTFDLRSKEKGNKSTISHTIEIKDGKTKITFTCKNNEQFFITFIF